MRTWTQLAVGVSVAVSRGSGATGALAGAGSGASNEVDLHIASYISGSSGTQSVDATHGGITLTASDDSDLDADAGAFSFAVGVKERGTGFTGALALGVSVALNNVGTDGGHSVSTYIDGSTVNAAGTLTLSSTSTAELRALAIGGSVSVAAGKGGAGAVGSIAGVGVGVGNVLRQTVESKITNSSSITTTGFGNVSLSAIDSARVKGDAGGRRHRDCGEPGWWGGDFRFHRVAVATNTVNNTVTAAIDSSTVTAAGALSLTARSQKEAGTDGYRIDALALGISVSGGLSTGSGLTGTFAGAGSGAQNRIDNTVAAYIKNSGGTKFVTANGGSATLTASDDASIRADTGGFAVAISVANGGGASGAISAGVSASVNEIGKHGGHSVSSYVENSKLTAAGDIGLNATSTASIYALAMGGAVGATGGGGGGGIGVGLAGAGSGNTIASTVQTYISSGSDVRATNLGNITMLAIDTPTITADAGGVAIALSLGGGGGGAGSLGRAASDNDITNHVYSYVDGSKVQAAGGLTLFAKEDATIDSLSIGGAVAVQAGGGGGGAGAAAGAGSGNTIHNETKAYIKDSLESASRGVTANGAILVTATDTSHSKSDAGGVGIALALGGGGGFAASIGIAVATNDISNTIEASVTNSTVKATGGDIKLSATSTATVGRADHRWRSRRHDRRRRRRRHRPGGRGLGEHDRQRHLRVCERRQLAANDHQWRHFADRDRHLDNHRRCRRRRGGGQPGRGRWRRVLARRGGVGQRHYQSRLRLRGRLQDPICRRLRAPRHGGCDD
jgi:hypothetical protein